MNKYRGLSDETLNQLIADRVMGWETEDLKNGLWRCKIDGRFEPGYYFCPSSNESKFFQYVVPRMTGLGYFLSCHLLQHAKEFMAWFRRYHDISEDMNVSTQHSEHERFCRAGCEAALIAIDEMEAASIKELSGGTK